MRKEVKELMYEQFLGKRCLVESNSGSRVKGKVVRIEIDRECEEEILNVDYGYIFKTKNIVNIEELIS